MIFIPATKSHRSGTCASTLLPSSRSACFPSPASSLANFSPKNFTRVGTFLFSTATFATFTAGSMPSTGTLLFTKYCSR